MKFVIRQFLIILVFGSYVWTILALVLVLFTNADFGLFDRQVLFFAGGSSLAYLDYYLRQRYTGGEHD